MSDEHENAQKNSERLRWLCGQGPAVTSEDAEKVATIGRSLALRGESIPDVSPAETRNEVVAEDVREIFVDYCGASHTYSEAEQMFDRCLARERAATLEDLALMWERTAHSHGHAMNDADWEHIKLWCASVRVYSEQKYGAMRAAGTETGETS